MLPLHAAVACCRWMLPLHAARRTSYVVCRIPQNQLNKWRRLQSYGITVSRMLCDVLTVILVTMPAAANTGAASFS
jgi:hypothetical protein